MSLCVWCVCPCRCCVGLPGATEEVKTEGGDGCWPPATRITAVAMDCGSLSMAPGVLKLYELGIDEVRAQKIWVGLVPLRERYCLTQL